MPAARAAISSDSPFVTLGTGREHNARYFDASDLEQRLRRQLALSAQRDWTGGGRHAIRAGYDWLRSRRTGGNEPSVHRLRLRRRLRARSQNRVARARLQRSPGAAVRAGRHADRALVARAGIRVQREDPGSLRAGPLGDRRALVGGPQRRYERVSSQATGGAPD